MRVFFVSFLLLAAPFSAGAAVLISEIAWMGSENSANDEWIELFNSGSSEILLDGWRITAADGSPDISLVGSIAAGSYFLLERTDDDSVVGITADLIFTGALSNSGEYLKLYNAAGAVADEVNVSDGWPAGDNSTKETMQSAEDNWITAAATPRAQNINISVPENSEEPPVQPSPAPSPQQIYSPPPVSPIRIYAGEDIASAVGSPISFVGFAANQEGEEIENARFFWNFGDGATQEGRSVSHIFFLPGDYITGLHVSFGGYTSSDYRRVRVVPNQVSIENVVVGSEGFVQLKNPSGVEIEIGGWIMEDANSRAFSLPPKTVIGAKSEISFANSLTGILQDSPALPFKIYYLNKSLTLEWRDEPASAIKMPAKPSIPQLVFSPSPVLKVVPEAPIPAAEDSAPLAVELAVESDLSESAQIISASASTSKFLFWSALIISAFAAAGFLFVRRARN